MGLFEDFAKGVSDAVTDIRQKVVEEPYFGRAVTDGFEPQAAAPEPTPGQGQQSTLFDQFAAQAVQQPAPDIERDAPEPGGGMER